MPISILYPAINRPPYIVTQEEMKRVIVNSLLVCVSISAGSTESAQAQFGTILLTHSSQAPVNTYKKGQNTFEVHHVSACISLPLP